MAFLFNAPNFLLLGFIITIFSCIIPFVSSLSTVSISETSNHTLICALIKSSNQQAFHLNCTSFPQGIQIPVNQNFSFSAIVAGNGFVCGLTHPSSSILLCWRFSINGTNMFNKRIYNGTALKQLDAGNSHICGIVNGTNRLECWQWRGFNRTIDQNQSFSSIAVGENFACGLSEIGKVTCFYSTGVARIEPTRNFSVVSAGFRHACAIYSDTHCLRCWGDMAGKEPEGKFVSLALGENRSCGLMSNQKVVCWGESRESNFSLPESLQDTQFISIEAKRSVFCGVLKSNYSLFCWGNEIFASNNFKVFDKVLPGPCTRTSECPCSIESLSSEICGQGYGLCRSCTSETPCLPSLHPPPDTPEGNESNVWDRRMVAFLVVGCVGSLALILVCCFFLIRYCKSGRGCSRVHDSGRLDETAPENGAQADEEQPAAAPENGAQADEEQPAAAPQLVRILEKRLSHLVSLGNGGCPLEEFSLEVLLQATGNFSEDNKIGTGSFGSVYHATLNDGREVAIKRAEISISTPYAIRREEDKDNAFLNELEALSRLNHKNLVRLLGFCEDSNERVLVYEFMQNGSLHDHLHRLQTSPLLSWAKRIKAALDAARGIEYLHVYAVPPIIHRDIKSSNILLDATWTAKVSDFGLSLMGPADEDSHLSLRAAGTVGYMDPEYYRLAQLTTKSDVYSFGVLLLEMLSGYKAIHKNENGVPRNVVDFVAPYIMQDQIHRVLDPHLPAPSPFEIEAVAYVGYVAVDCVNPEGRDRPTMTEIVHCLERALATCLAHPTLSRSTTDSST
ncbi:serine/threonine-protein kinase-like protein CCR4 [Corylus avellana]|uniref:serine/threonine-protein kinase-like protein CCR4 n=1 Tax=Corylus avellana TaxID=13451 RepID=UPI001E204F90|nr:serine/threonine-protein kinase-like protein CCR4 [Corylus avellana]